jgi:phosphoribosylformylglycinamidine synthase
MGCEVEIEGELSGAALLFSETPSRIVVSATDENVERILEIARESRVGAAVIGRTGGEDFIIKANKETIINRPISEIESRWRNVLPEALEVASLVSAEEGLTS